MTAAVIGIIRLTCTIVRMIGATAGSCFAFLRFTDIIRSIRYIRCLRTLFPMAVTVILVIRLTFAIVNMIGAFAGLRFALL